MPAARQMPISRNSIFPGGNDYPVKAADVDGVKVCDETKEVVEPIIVCLAPGAR